MHEQSDSKKGLLSPQEQKINKKVKKMPKENNKMIEAKTQWSLGMSGPPFPTIPNALLSALLGATMLCFSRGLTTCVSHGNTYCHF